MRFESAHGQMARKSGQLAKPAFDIPQQQFKPSAEDYKQREGSERKLIPTTKTS